jgi:entericidin B
MHTLKKMLIAVSALAVISAVLAGCNTVKGAGEDIQAGGSAIARAAS